MALIETTIYVTNLPNCVAIDVVYGIGIHKVPPELLEIHMRVATVAKRTVLTQLTTNLEAKMPAVSIQIYDVPLDTDFELPKLVRQ